MIIIMGDIMKQKKFNQVKIDNKRIRLNIKYLKFKIFLNKF